MRINMPRLRKDWNALDAEDPLMSNVTAQEVSINAVAKC